MRGQEPLVLLHGLGMSARAWSGVRALLEPHHVVFAPNLLGHPGGAVPTRRPVELASLVDDVERTLDELGLDRPHIAGNSLGGWVAVELARRGRARTVCALSPAGMWTAGTAGQTIGVRKIRKAVRLSRIGRRLPFVMRSARVRRLAFRDVALGGDHLSAREALEATIDLLSCSILEDVLTTGDEIAPLDPPPCPITLAWSGDDAIVPLELNGVVARRRIPRARFCVLADVGHVPMIDDPEQVAAAILESTGVRHSPAESASWTR